MGFLLFNVAAHEARQCSGDPVAGTPNHNPITDGRLRVGGASDRQLGRAHPDCPPRSDSSRRRFDPRGRWTGEVAGGCSGSSGPLPSRSVGSVKTERSPDNSCALIRNTSTTSTRSTNGRGTRGSMSKGKCSTSRRAGRRANRWYPFERRGPPREPNKWA